MIHGNVSEITGDTIKRLVEERVPESRELDYKQDPPKLDDKQGKKELLKDVSAFANAHGGYLVYGIAEQDGIPDYIHGVGTINADTTTQQIQNVLRDGIEPRVPGIQVRVLTAPDDKTVIVIHIPRSWQAPHMIKAEPCFYTRGSAGNIPLDVYQVRNAFESASGVENKLRDFRNGRLARIIAGDTPVPLRGDGAAVILHILPVSAFDRPQHLDIVELDKRHEDYPPLDFCLDGFENQRFDRRINLDGVVRVKLRPRDGTLTSYVQVYKSGCIEAVDIGKVEILNRETPRPLVEAQGIERMLISGTSRYIKLLESLSVEPPLILSISVAGLQGCRLFASNVESANGSIDRSPLVLPEVLILGYAEPAFEVLRPVFDALWQSSGYTHSPHYEMWKRDAAR